MTWRTSWSGGDWQVAALLAALPFEAGLRTQWAAHALHWALAAKSPHLAARSHQVLPPFFSIFFCQLPSRAGSRGIPVES